jgi:hypothetical protein
MEMQQMTERLLAVQEEMWAEMNIKLDAFRDKLDADMEKTDAETNAIKARMKAIHATTKAIPDKLHAHQEKTEATDLKPNTGEKEAVAERQENPKRSHFSL